MPIGVSAPITNEFDREMISRGDSAQDGPEGSLRATAAEGFGGSKGDAFEDEDAAVYRRAKFSVDELHRARKFEKSIKLK